SSRRFLLTTSWSWRFLQQDRRCIAWPYSVNVHLLLMIISESLSASGKLEDLASAHAALWTATKTAPLGLSALSCAQPPRSCASFADGASGSASESHSWPRGIFAQHFFAEAKCRYGPLQVGARRILYGCRFVRF